MSDAGQTAQAVPEGRPTITDEMLSEQGVPQEMWAQAQEEFEQECRALEELGPATFELGEEDHGVISSSDLSTLTSSAIQATGRVDVPTYTSLHHLELHRPSAELIRANPMHRIDHVDVVGADDEVLAALAANPRMRSVSVHGRVTEADVERATQEAQEMNVMIEEDLASMVEAGDLTQDEADQQPRVTVRHQLGGGPVSDDGLRTLAGHPALTDLSITGSEISDEALGEVLGSLPRLVVLRIGSDRVTGAFGRALPAESLLVLGVRSEALDSAQVAAWPVLPQVSHLTLDGPDIVDTIDVAALAASFPGLEVLQLGAGQDESGPDDRLIPVLAALPGVEVNGLTLSPRAIQKWAAKRGIELPALQG